MSHPPPRRNTPRRRPITPSTLLGATSLVLPALTLIRIGSLFPLAYASVLSIATFLFYGYDKMQARNLEWRVKEATLHVLAVVGGWPGALAGMHYFQHKTRKVAFLVPFWVIICGWQIGLWCVFWRG